MRCNAVATATIIGGTDRRPEWQNRKIGEQLIGKQREALAVQQRVDQDRRDAALAEARRRDEHVGLPRRQTQTGTASVT